jgi:hypothetical protein
MPGRQALPDRRAHAPCAALDEQNVPRGWRTPGELRLPGATRVGRWAVEAHGSRQCRAQEKRALVRQTCPLALHQAQRPIQAAAPSERLAEGMDHPTRANWRRAKPVRRRQQHRGGRHRATGLARSLVRKRRAPEQKPAKGPTAAPVCQGAAATTPSPGPPRPPSQAPPAPAARRRATAGRQGRCGEPAPPPNHPRGATPNDAQAGPRWHGPTRPTGP